jgi:hypothetical protein
MRAFKGYMTLEATIIVPIVICVFVLIIYFTNYMYVRCILSQDCFSIALEATDNNMNEKYNSHAERSEGESGSRAKKYFGQSSLCFLVSDKSKNTVMVEGSTETKHSAMGSYYLKPQNGWGLKASFSATKRKYASHIRTIKRLSDMGKEIIED